MARPNDTTPRRSIKFLVMLAALAALMGVVATGCGTSMALAAREEGAFLQLPRLTTGSPCRCATP